MKQEKSLAMQARARARIPGITQLLSKRPDQFSEGVWPGYFASAKGARVQDLDGNSFLDMSIGGIGANVLGYQDPDVDKAVVAAIRAGSSSSLNAPEEVELAEAMCRLHPWAEMVRLARTGGEAMAVGVRIARAHTQRDVVAFCGYHGWHDWYLAANLQDDGALDHHLLSGLSPRGVPKALRGTTIPYEYNDLASLEAIAERHAEQLAAIVLEPIRGEPPDPAFVDGIRNIANRTGAVFIVDEISAGFRLNPGGSHMVLGIHPDVAVFSKALGNGYPIAAIIGKASPMRAVETTFVSSTYWTERIGPAAALATIHKFENEKVHQHLDKVGRRVQDVWSQAAAEAGLAVEVGGIPPLAHFSFEADHLVRKAFFVQEMLGRGFLASNSFYAMFAHQESHVEAYSQATHEIMRQAARLGDQVKGALRGRPSNPGFARMVR